MKKYICTLALAGALVMPTSILAQDTGGGIQPLPPQGDFGGQQPPPSGGSFSPPGGGGFQPQSDGQQPPFAGEQRFGSQSPFPGNQGFPGGGQPPQQGGQFPPQGGGQFPPPQGGKFPSQGGQFPPQQFGGQFQDGQNQQFPRDQFQRQPQQSQFPNQEKRPTPFFNEVNQKQQPTPFFNQVKERSEKRMESKNQFENEEEGFGFESEEVDQQDYVDPREIQQAQKQINDLKKQAQRLVKKVAKNAALANEAVELQNFLTELGNYATGIQSGARETLQEFYDAELWERINGFQARIEMPTEISKMEKDLARLEKLIATKTFQVDGVDMGLVRSKIEEIRNAVNGAKNALSSGDVEGAREYLQVVYEGTHPGEIHGVLQQLREITKQLKTIKNAEIKQAIMEVISPAYEAVAAGDFREANMALSEINREIFSLFGKLKNTRTVNTDLRTKMRALEQKLEGRIQEIEAQGTTTNGQPGAFIPYQSSQSASAIGSFLGSVKGFLGF
ncbi:MAG: hypothetical protein Q8R20_03480 [Nanoarchaeota archaeon]|nr:hypothetical protein [Nanoarchaeota archaeon]